MIEKEELLSIVPHRGRMLLLSRVKGYNVKERSLEAEFDITEDCLFYDSAAAGVPAWVGIEFIAQAIAALAGLRGREKGEEPQLGFILSISSVETELSFFRAGSTVEIKVKEKGYMDAVHSFEGRIFLEGRKVLEGSLTVMDADNEQIQALKKEHKIT